MNSKFSACEVKVKHSKEEALAKIEYLASVKHRKIKGLRAYKCDYCDGWHLTSKEESQ
jgi:hypothetical protein